MRYGFTTGSCACAGAKAAASLLLLGEALDGVRIIVPAGIEYKAEVLELKSGNGWASCGIKKDGGDDPDVTTGLIIYARVEVAESGTDKPVTDKPVTDKPVWDKSVTAKPQVDKPGTDTGLTIIILGGEGIGHVTAPGLDRPVGAPAINSTPLRMIREAVEEVAGKAGFNGVLMVTISAPGGDIVAEKTFNPKLGIKGGISIIGTSGLVKPMSSAAILETITLELNQRRALGFDHAVIAPGNYGADYMKKVYSYDMENSVKCSNYIGKTLEIALQKGFKKILLAGHIGKLIKISGGILYTHSGAVDKRMELLERAAALEGIDEQVLLKVRNSLNTEEALSFLYGESCFERIMNHIMEGIMDTLEGHIRNCCKDLGLPPGVSMDIDCIMFSSVYGELAKSKGVSEWSILLEQAAGQRT